METTARHKFLGQSKPKSFQAEHLRTQSCLLLIFHSITLFYLFLFCVDDCNVNTHTNIFVYFKLVSSPYFLFIFFYLITLFNFLFVLCRRLQCGHLCQYFVSTLISFLIYFLLFHFLFIFFYSITLFLSFLCCFDDCNVNTHANILFEL